MFKGSLCTSNFQPYFLSASSQVFGVRSCGGNIVVAMGTNPLRDCAALDVADFTNADFTLLMCADCFPGCTTPCSLAPIATLWGLQEVPLSSCPLTGVPSCPERGTIPSLGWGESKEGRGCSGPVRVPFSWRSCISQDDIGRSILDCPRCSPIGVLSCQSGVIALSVTPKE